MKTFLNFNINIKLRILCGFFTTLFNLMVTPFMAIFFSEYYSITTVGIIIFIGMTLVILGNLYGGQIADLYSRKKILILGIYINAISLLIIGVFIELDLFIIPIVIIYWANMFFSNLYKPALSSLIIEITTDEDRKQIFTYNYWFANLASALGASIGGLFFTNYSGVMYLAIGLATLIISLIYQLFMKDQKRDNNVQKKENIFKNYSNVLSDYRFTLFVLSGAFIFSNEKHITNYVSVNLKESSIINSIGGFTFNAVNTVAILQILNTIVIVVFSIFVYKYTKNMKPNHILLLGLVLYSLFYSFTIVTTDLLYLAIFVIVASIGELIYVPSYQAAQVELMDTEKAGTYSAVSSIFTQCAPLIASLYLLISDYVNGIILFIIIFSLNIIAIIYVYITKIALENEKIIKG